MARNNVVAIKVEKLVLSEAVVLPCRQESTVDRFRGLLRSIAAQAAERIVLIAERCSGYSGEQRRNGIGNPNRGILF